MPKIDCSNINNFMAERDRLCASLKLCKESCPLFEIRDDHKVKCGLAILNNIDKAVKIVQKWSDEHPTKTILEDFLEKYPTALVDEDGIPTEVCPSDIICKLHDETCTNDCQACWNRPYTESK